MLEVEDFDSWRISVQVLTPQDNDTESKLTTPDEEAKRTPSGKQSLQRKANSSTNTPFTTTIRIAAHPAESEDVNGKQVPNPR